MTLAIPYSGFTGTGQADGEYVLVTSPPAALLSLTYTTLVPSERANVEGVILIKIVVFEPNIRFDI
jgi:monoamine oxidase